MKKLLIRALSGIIYIALILGCFFGGDNWFATLTVCFALLAYEESTNIISGPIRWRNSGVPLLDMLSLTALICVFANILPVWTLIGLLIIRSVIQLYVRSENPARRLALSFFQIFYLGIGLGSMLALAQIGNAVLAILFFIWLNDTGAFVVGTLIGRHKLYERISPKKTWEGFLGGLIFSVGASVLFSVFLTDWFCVLPPASLPEWIGLAVITVLFATWGDLVESLLKRTLNIKDSGNLIPGHGGILDRIDSLLLAMPATWVFLKIIDVL